MQNYSITPISIVESLYEQLALSIHRDTAEQVGLIHFCTLGRRHILIIHK